jgi:hypothetical protein
MRNHSSEIICGVDQPKPMDFFLGTTVFALIQAFKQGCRIFLDTIYQNGKRCIKRTQNYSSKIEIKLSK